MGPSLARRVRRAAERAGNGSRVLAVSRFRRATRAKPRGRRDSDPRVRLHECAGHQRPAALPQRDVPRRRKFGTTGSDRHHLDDNTVPARVAEHFNDARMVVFSTGNVYPLVPANGPAPTEQDPPMPVGEYAQSCLGRERVVEFVSRESGLRALMFRLNYAVDLRAALVDVARKVHEEPIDLTVGCFNAIWQGANSYALRSLELCESPPQVLNVTGPDRISVREAAQWFGAFFNREPRFVNQEGPVALLSDSSRCRACSVSLVFRSGACASGWRTGWRPAARAEQADAFRGRRWPLLTACRESTHCAARCAAGSSFRASARADERSARLDERRQVR